MKRHAAELITRDPERFFHHDRVFLNNPVVMQGVCFALLVVNSVSARIDRTEAKPDHLAHLQADAGKGAAQ